MKSIMANGEICTKTLLLHNCNRFACYIIIALVPIAKQIVKRYFKKKLNPHKSLWKSSSGKDTSIHESRQL
jgi:hypothetical protein